MMKYKHSTRLAKVYDSLEEGLTLAVTHDKIASLQPFITEIAANKYLNMFDKSTVK